MIRKTFSVPPLGCNCSIIGDPVTKQAIVVDPGGAHERILREVQQIGFDGHAYPPHPCPPRPFSGIRRNEEGDRGNVVSASGRSGPLEESGSAVLMFGVAYVPVPLPDYWLKDEEKLLVGRVSAVALHTPGHTPGSMSFHFPVDNVVLGRRYTFSRQHRPHRSLGRRFRSHRAIHSRAVVYLG